MTAKIKPHTTIFRFTIDHPPSVSSLSEPTAKKSTKTKKPFDNRLYILYYICCDIGAWLSLVEHLAWDQGVAGSNPAAPTNLHTVQ